MTGLKSGDLLGSMVWEASSHLSFSNSCMVYSLPKTESIDLVWMLVIRLAYANTVMMKLKTHYIKAV